MSFEYGRQTLGIKNPFRFEGVVMATLGMVITALGIITLLSIQGYVQEGNRIQGFASMGVGAFLVISGLVSVGRGLFRVFRFFVGRNVPSSLAPNLSSQNEGTEIAYTAQNIDEMLMGRKNLTFKEPRGFFARMVHSMFPKLLFMPYPIRNLAQGILKGMAHTLFALTCFGLAWFSGYTQLTDITSTPAIDWLVAGLIVYIVMVWMKQIRSTKQRALSKHVDSMGISEIAGGIVLSIMLPVILSYVHNAVQPLPAFPIEGHMMALACTLGLSFMLVVLVTTMIVSRISTGDPETAVSEYRDNWQENVHPREVYINFENIIMANRRFKEIPNRVYRAFDPKLIEEGSNDKGSFTGRIIQETQPEFKEIKFSNIFRICRASNTVLSAIMLSLSAFFLFYGIDVFSDAQNQNMNTIVTYAFYPVLLWIFGRYLYNATHIFWSEIQFQSKVVMFNCEGTYTESKLSSGAAIHDSNRSENVIVRSSMTPWFIVSKLVTSTFSEPGQNNLERSRYILEMHNDDNECESIVGEMRTFIQNRESIATVSNRDIQSASTLHTMNEQSRYATERTVQLPQGESPMALESQGEEDARA